MIAAVSFHLNVAYFALNRLQSFVVVGARRVQSIYGPTFPPRECRVRVCVLSHSILDRYNVWIIWRRDMTFETRDAVATWWQPRWHRQRPESIQRDKKATKRPNSKGVLKVADNIISAYICIKRGSSNWHMHLHT